MVYLIEKIVLMVVSRISIKEIKFSDKAGATLDSSDENTIFHKNMDEVVYFFESTGYNVMFIEDLDRFKNQNIFIKLREINTILNQYENIKNRVVFVYAVRDDLFNDTDRTKFFEYIIPIIPVISSTNSKELLLKRLDKDNDKYDDIEIDESYIDMVSPYINDMRLLTNIYNEFVTYKKSLQGTYTLKLKDIQLFSLILFKNLFPKDFSDLQNDEGIVKKAFEVKRLIISKQRIQLESSRDRCLDLLERIDNDVLNNMREVKISMLYFLTGNKGMFKEAHISGRWYSHEYILNDTYDIDNLRLVNNVHYWGSVHNNPLSYNFGSASDLEELDNYIIRCKEIKSKSAYEKEKLKYKIEDFANEIHRLSSKSIKELIVDYGIEYVLPEEIRENKLLTFLIRSGFIDEEYYNYINYFYANSITQGEMNFILSIRNLEALDFNYSLINVDQVIKRLQVYEFEQKEIYNFDLLDFLLRNMQHAEKLDLFITQLSDEHEISLAFIDEYIKISKDLEKFVHILSSMWPNMWNFIYNNNTFTSERKSRYLELICNYSDTDKIVEMNQTGVLKKYFEEQKDILITMRYVPKDKITTIIQKLDIRFSDITVGNYEIDLFDWIYENKHFVLNMAMIEKVFEIKYPNELEYLFLSNFSTINRLECHPLLDLIEEDVHGYIKDIVLGISTNNDESIECTLELIRKAEDVTIALGLVEKESVMLDYLTKCDFPYLNEDKRNPLKLVWSLWITLNKLAASYENLIEYWNNFGFDDIMDTYLANKVDDLIEMKIPEDIDEELLKDILTSNLELSIYEKYIAILPRIGNIISLSKINRDHMIILLESNYFEFDEEFAKQLNKEHSDLYTYGLILNKVKVLDTTTGYVISIEDITKIVESVKLSEKEKIEFIKISSIQDYNTKIALFLRNTKIQIDIDMFNNAWEVLEVKDRYELLINQIQILDNDALSICFSELDDEYKKLTFRERSRKVILTLNAYNEKLVEHLKEMKYITSHPIENGHIACWVKKVK